MNDYYVQGIFYFSNFFIAAFMLRYAWKFLRQTIQHKDRRPWDLLFLAALFYFIHHILSLFDLYGTLTLFNQDINYYEMATEFIFSGLILYTIITQQNLILHKAKLIIRRKRR
ncbi:MAG: hypothetical protein AABX70_07285 [Nanoarchaeota archaeon]